MRPTLLHRTFLLSAILVLLLLQPLWSQTPVTVSRLSNQCDSLLGTSFHPDGQEALLQVSNQEKQTIPLLFYANITYRLAFACSPEEGRVEFQLHDSDRNLLFDSHSCNFPAWWDFRFASTTPCHLTMRVVVKENKTTTNQYLMCRLGFYQDDKSN